jgi:hypothetical protein
MKILYNENPLASIIELDDVEKKELWYKIKIEELESLLFSAHYHAREGKDGKETDMIKVREYLDPEYYCTDEKSPLEKRVDEMYECYIEELNSAHSGDCTCFACSCGKCHVEDMVGVNTIEGLGKHSAHKIEYLFREGKNIHQVIAALEDYAPEMTDSWRGDIEGWKYHLPRWKEEAAHAAMWLKKYRDEHGFV